MNEEKYPTTCTCDKCGKELTQDEICDGGHDTILCHECFAKQVMKGGSIYQWK